MKTDRSVRALLAVIAVLLGANLLVNIASSGTSRVAFAAGIPDSGAQLQAVVDATQDISKKVDHLTAFLESGKMEIKMQDEKSGK